MWLHSPDPQFREKVTDIVELYLCPPPGSTVVCVDEKPNIQATHRKHPDRPSAPGQDGRRDFEYVRHGTQTLLAAFRVHTGEVIVLEPWAARLEAMIHGRGDYGDVKVKARAGHLQITTKDDQGVEAPLARATPLVGGHYGLSFHTHAGRWEPMPVEEHEESINI